MKSRKLKIKLDHLIVGGILLACAGTVRQFLFNDRAFDDEPSSITATINEPTSPIKSEQSEQVRTSEPPLCEPSKKETSFKKLMQLEYTEPHRQIASVDDTTLHTELPKAENSLNLEIAKPPKAHRLDIWSGFGSNYLKFSQKDSSGIENGQFSSVTLPTLMVETRLVWSDNWSYVFAYNQMPGKIETKGNLRLDNDTFTWSYFSFEAERHVFDGPFGSRIFVLGGVQRHQMPFLVGGTTYDVDLIQTELSTASVGARIELKPVDKWLIEGFMRYQTPLTSEASNGGDFKITGGLSFDGLVGISRALTPRWSFGVFWFGQSHNLNYTYTSSDQSVQRDGTQVLFNSDLQVRLGYQWSFGKD
ncbi:MAG: hypothetical protein J7501_06575 [Bdellovibrio sp.]|nr:hypothetical protein [Bdellovibrio sp.]